MKKFYLLLFVAILAALGQLLAVNSCSVGRLVYPQTIQVTQKAENPDSTWEVFKDDSPNQLMTVQLFDGHPKDKASLVPDSETTEDKRLTRVWKLTENKARRYWIALGYDHTNLLLVRPIDPGVSSCEVTYDSQITVAGQPLVTAVTLR